MGSNERVSGIVQLNIDGQLLSIRLDLPTEPVKPHRTLPIFQQMTNSFVDLSVKAVEEQGQAITCKAGCGACCRQPVPISELEMYQIAELVESMPEPRRSEVRRRFSDAYEHFDKIGWFDRVAACDEMGKTAPISVVKQELQKLVDDYFVEGIPCPFLENEACSIHPARPLVCREYLVTSPAEYCSRPNREDVRRIDLLVSPSKTVQYLSRDERMADLGILPLIRALELAKSFPESFEEKKSQEWVGEFFDRLSGDNGSDESPGPTTRNAEGRSKNPKNADIYGTA